VTMSGELGRCRWTRWPLVATLVLGVAATTWAQEPRDRPLPLGYTSLNQTIINGQVRLALEYERQALAMLNAAGDPGSLADMRQLVYDGYSMVRYAVSGIRWAKDKAKFPNPMLQIQDDAMEEIRAKLRTCLTELGRVAVGDGDRLAPAGECLRVTISDIETLLAGMP
jgi:hypothetical protein